MCVAFDGGVVPLAEALVGVFAALAAGIVATDMFRCGNEGASISERGGGRVKTRTQVVGNKNSSCGKRETW